MHGADIDISVAHSARVVRFLAAEAGIRQFLDLGTGIPAVGNTHEVAQSAAPEAGARSAMWGGVARKPPG